MAAAVLPDDVLVEVLQRLPLHSLAACRWVCKAWRDIIYGRLRSRLLSPSVRGIFINYVVYGMSEFFSRPSAGPTICGGLDFLPCEGVEVRDHCNGLLLCTDWEDESWYVVNPATQGWARLPQRPPPHMQGLDQTAFLAFDQIMSPHYEWPPASHVMHVFSSMTQRWDKKTFLRQGEAAGVVADMASSRSWYKNNHAVYWRGALYIHCQCDFVMRMCLSSYKYQVIKKPHQFGLYPSAHLGRSVKGVYCAIFHTGHGLQLWHLDESSCGQIKWVLKHDTNLASFDKKIHLDGDDDYAQQMDKQWILQDVNYRRGSDFGYGPHRCENWVAPTEEKFEWNSDDDNILDIEHAAEGRWSGYIGFLGFHPYREVVFLTLALDGAVAYDWNSSKFQYLGRILPKDYREIAMQCAGIDTCFPYTPCWMHEFPRKSSESQLEADEQLSGNSLESQVQPDPHFT
ncbi:hypothetical protein ACQ4PT_016748 [Festuca glaucescens]